MCASPSLAVQPLLNRLLAPALRRWSYGQVRRIRCRRAPQALRHLSGRQQRIQEHLGRARTAIIGFCQKSAGATYSREHTLVGGNTSVVSSGARIMVVTPYSFCCTVMADAHPCSVSTSRAEGFASVLQL